MFDADDFQIPLRTQSTWGWYETRTDRELRLEDATTLYETSRGPVPYLDRMGLQRAGDPIADEFATGAWYHFNPRRAHLGRLALVRPDGTGLDDPATLTDVRTELDLWTGSVQAEYVLDGERVRVTTVADPRDHRFAVRVESGLLLRGWGVAWVFDEQPDDLAAFELPLAQETVWDRQAEVRHWNARRTVERLTYDVSVHTTGGLRQEAESVVAHAAAAARGRGGAWRWAVNRTSPTSPPSSTPRRTGGRSTGAPAPRSASPAARTSALRNSNAASSSRSTSWPSTARAPRLPRSPA